MDVSSSRTRRGIKRSKPTSVSVEVIVNNAGITPRTPHEEDEPPAWDEVLTIPIWAVATICASGLGMACWRAFRRIVNIGSINGQLASMARSIMPPPNRHPYRRFTPKRWARKAPPRASPQRHRAWLYRHRHGGGGAGRSAGQDRGAAFRWGGWVMRRKSRAGFCSWWQMKADLLPDRTMSSMAASICMRIHLLSMPGLTRPSRATNNGGL